MTAETVKREFNGSLEPARKCLQSEVNEFDQYLAGDVWGYVIADDDGNQIDSCWGFFGHEYCLAEARSALQYAEAHEQDKACKVFESSHD